MADGSAIVAYGIVDIFETPEPECPSLAPGRVTAVARVRADRSMQVIVDGDSGPSRRSISGIAVDKTGLEPAVSYTKYLNNLADEVHLVYKGNDLPIVDVVWFHGADFDSAGTLWALYSGPDAIGRLGWVHLTNGVVTEVHRFTLDDNVNVLAVGCDGFAYVGGETDGQTEPTYTSYELYKIDLSTGNVVARTPPGMDYNRFLADLAVGCDTNELYGSLETAIAGLVDVELGRASTVGGITGFTGLVQLSHADYDSPVTMDYDGQLYLYQELDLPRPGGGTWYDLAMVPTGVMASTCPTLTGSSPIALPTCGDTQTMHLLSSTTRWKPQRGPEDVHIHVESAERLDIGQNFVVTITSANGTPSFVRPFNATESPSAPYRYQMRWFGPQQDGGGQALRRGNYRISVEAKRLSDGVVVSTAPNDPNSVVSLVEVQGLEILECAQVPGFPCAPTAAAELDVNPGTGGGRSVFPDAPAQDGSFRDTLLVRASLDPNLGADSGLVTVHFGWVDVDDPSASTAPIDNDLVFPNPPDNKDEDATITSSAAASPTYGGAAVIALHVSKRQGNNYRVIASTHAGWLGTVCAHYSNDHGAVQRAPCDPPNPPPVPPPPPTPLPPDEVNQVSAMVTVWRVLHVELDHLDSSQVSQGTFDTLSNSTKVTPLTLEDNSANWEPDGMWVGADLWPDLVYPNLHFRIVASNDKKLTVASPDNLCQDHQACPSGAAYKITDDYWVDLLAELPLSLLTTSLARAYIRVEPWTQNPTPVHPFVRNITDLAVSQFKELMSSPSYWAAEVVSAFESMEGFDNDPDNEPGGGTLGINVWPGMSLPAILLQPIAVVFSETIRDYAVEYQLTSPELERTVAHEVLCHSLDVGHSTGQNLCYEHPINGPSGATVTDQQVAKLRIIAAPKLRVNECDPVCPTPPSGW